MYSDLKKLENTEAQGKLWDSYEKVKMVRKEGDLHPSGISFSIYGIQLKLGSVVAPDKRR